MDSNEYIVFRKSIENNLDRYSCILENIPEGRLNINKNYLGKIYSSLLLDKINFDGRSPSKDEVYKKYLELEKLFEETLKKISL